MEKIFVKQLGTCLENNAENKELLTKLGLINDTKDIKKPIKHDSVDFVRVGRPKRRK
jgi:hypothetical protein